MSKLSPPSSPTQAHHPAIPEDQEETGSIPSKSHRNSDSKWPRWGLSRSETDVLLLSTGLKVLLFPAYRSTDFEVHRNWLAITHSLPVSQWYYDTTSEWTLDYPPFFAYFEKLLSIPAALIDPKIVDLNNLGYSEWTVIAYQRSTVILTELILGVVLLRFIRGAVDTSRQRIISASLFLHPGFLIIDHIHFQYNGFMYGILLWSILMAREGHKLSSGILFAILLNFKHIYMYLAPAYFIYLLRSYCMSVSGEILPTRFISLANAVIVVFVVSLGPFILMGQLPQLLSRLFPFTRGLNHAYWAPNAWAIVTAADRVLLQFAKRFGVALSLNESGVASTSRGLVGDTVFTVIPNIKPVQTFAITVGFQAIFLVKLWRSPTYKSFLAALTLCGYSSFMFGWHVHEKAVLLVLVPLSLLAVDSYAYFKTFLIASTAGVFSLFPLLFTPAASLIAVVYSLLWGASVLLPINRQIYEFPRSVPWVILETLENIYLVGFIALQGFVALFPLLTQNRSGSAALEFLPLLVTSVYCAIGLIWAFLRLSVIYLKQQY
ncbi:glycosyltransferase family 57 protein [Hygrophoropsis aurantiaca]|uniref:Glycosyltransferase family 57 protein n=1 Tax=Hygrophoropsis aurantiaca TaxID=72124 RepID=A0ACB8AU69_9AGAM|nr:glycosyltransferase family 57 protein [Hygrophoropsis aurantiaca]